MFEVSGWWKLETTGQHCVNGEAAARTTIKTDKKMDLTKRYQAKWLTYKTRGESAGCSKCTHPKVGCSM